MIGTHNSRHNPPFHPDKKSYGEQDFEEIIRLMERVFDDAAAQRLHPTDARSILSRLRDIRDITNDAIQELEHLYKNGQGYQQ